MPPMDIEISVLEDGINEFDFLAKPEELDLILEDTVFAEDVSVELRITRSSDTLTLTARCVTRADRTCARCLRTFKDGVESEFYEVAELDGEKLRLLDDQYDGDPGFLNRAPGIFVIDPLVREAVLVSSPMKPVCKEDCKGLCPQCGADRNEQECNCEESHGHTVWEALKDLAQNEKD